MKIGFDVTVLAQPHPRGVQRAAEELCGALERRGNIEVVRLAPPRGVTPRAWRARELPRLVRDQKLDGLHSFTSAFARGASCKRVQTIHELPWRHGVTENAGWRHRLWARLGPGLADATVCPTEFVARDARAFAWIGKDKVRALPWGVGEPFTPFPPPGEVDEALLDRYRLGEVPFALCLGAVRAKKSLAAVLHGIAALRERRGRAHELRVVVTGPETPDLRRDLGLAAQLGLSGSVLTLGEAEEADLPGLIRLAGAVCVLSRSEGFGFPALEALACGTPAIVARASAQAEAAGAAAVAVDPEDAEAVATALQEALERREALRFQLPTTVADRTWDACAERVEALWTELLGSRR